MKASILRGFFIFVFVRSLKKIAVYFRAQYKLDLRALALMRISVGLVVLADLVIRAQSIVAHYTDEGILPIHLLKEFYNKQVYYSFHTLNGSLGWQTFLFILNALIAVALILGYRTRLSTILAWIFMVSLQNRDPFIQQGGDDLLRLTLFFGMFMPWGKFYSLDVKRCGQTVSKYHFSAASVGYLLLIVSVYLFSSLLKTSPEWRSEGTAIYYVLSLDQLKIGLGYWLYEHPGLMKALTHVVFYTELIAPLLVMIPFKNSLFRGIGVMLILILHIGIALNVYVGLFFVIGMSSAAGLLPSGIMDKMEAVLIKTKRRLSSGFSKGIIRSPLLKITRTSFLTGVILFCLLMNLGNLKWFPYRVAGPILKVNDLLKLEQFWGMFSPNIYKTDGWYVYRGIKKDNTDWDLYHDKAGLDLSKPDRVSEMYESDRWRKFAENYEKVEYNFIKPYYCRYLIRKWNTEHPENKIEGLYILFEREISLPNYRTKPVKQENVCLCYENEPLK